MESKLINDTSCIIFKGWFLQICDVPNVQFLVLTSCCYIFTRWVNCNAVDLGIMSLELESDCEILIPDLEPTVPTNCNKIWLDIFNDWWISDRTDPIRVEMIWLGELFFSLNVVQFVFSFSSTTKNLSIVWTHSTCENFLLVSYKSVCTCSINQIPKSQFLVPWGW